MNYDSVKKYFYACRLAAFGDIIFSFTHSLTHSLTHLIAVSRSSTMDAQAYYSQLVLNFPQERRLIADYSKLVAPNHSEMHSLSWSER